MRTSIGAAQKMHIGLGHPRCGTGFTASLLQANDVDVRHEDIGPERIDSWIEHPEDDALLSRLVGRPISRADKHVWRNAYGPLKKSGRLEFQLDQLGRVRKEHLAKLVETSERLGHAPDEAARQLGQQVYTAIFTAAEVTTAAAGLPLEFVTDDSAHDYEQKHLPEGAWPPTGWYADWASGLDVFDLPRHESPIELCWLVYRMRDALSSAK